MLQNVELALRWPLADGGDTVTLVFTAYTDDLTLALSSFLADNLGICSNCDIINPPTTPGIPGAGNSGKHPGDPWGGPCVTWVLVPSETRGGPVAHLFLQTVLTNALGGVCVPSPH